MKKLLLGLAIGFQSLGQSYQYSLDLGTLANDQLNVSLNVPKQKGKSAVFAFPRMVPGTYSVDNYGRYIDNLVAKDAKGKKLKVQRLSENTFKITSAKKLKTIQYQVNDSFDDALNAKAIFEPAATNFEENKNILLNNHGIFGYFQGQEKLPYRVEIKHPSTLFGATALTDQDVSQTKDVFEANSYNYLVDNPIMYCKPDTANIKVGGADILISVYSPNAMVPAKFLAEKAEPLLKAQAQYLGGKLPISKYAFIVYLAAGPGISGSEGALEHSNSSVYYFHEMPKEAFGQYFTDVAAHEFFHILTPLNVHSEQIHYFNFDQPKMSRHLWLYEGTTEYHAHAVQVQNGLISPADFYKVISDKISFAQNQFDDTLPFTQLSLGALDKHENQYGNVYQKGALIGMCIDLLMRKHTQGQKGLIDLELELSQKYGPQRPFIDADLFNEIGQIAPKEVYDFLISSVAGNKPLPIRELLAEVGIQLDAEKKVKVFNWGNAFLRFDNQKRMVVSDISMLNDMGKAIGYQQDDIIDAINGTKVNSENFASVRAAWASTVKEGDDMEVSLVRNGQNHVVHTKVVAGYQSKKNNLSESENASSQQVSLRKAWLKTL